MTAICPGLPAEVVGQADADHVDVVEGLGGIKGVNSRRSAEVSVVQADVKILNAGH